MLFGVPSSVIDGESPNSDRNCRAYAHDQNYPSSFHEDFDDSCWEDIKTANTQSYEKRVRSKKISRNKRKKGRKSPPSAPKLDPHVFAEMFGVFQEARERVNQTANDADTCLQVARAINEFKEHLRYKGTDYNEFKLNALSRLEDLIAVIGGLLNTKNFVGFISVLHLYLRTFYSQPVTIKLVEYALQAFQLGKSFVHVSGSEWEDLDTQSGEDDLEEKFATMRRILKNWKDHKHCDLARNCANAINVLVAFGFFPSLKENPLSVAGFDLFRARVWDVQRDSVDFLEMMLETSVFFLERGYIAFSKGDLSLLLYSDSEIASREKEYALLASALPLLEAGRITELKKFGEDIKDDQDFEVRLEALIGKLSGMLKTEKSTYVRNTLTNRLVVLSKVRTALVMCQKASCIREKPYGILIHGGSAVGKSMINAIVLKVLLHANGFNSGKEHIVTLNDSDKFQSEYRAHHSAVTMDDYGNTKSQHYDVAPTNKIIDFLNNVPKAALNPNVELKGNVMIQPKIVSLTTNVKKLMAENFSNEPVSILRRFNVVLDVTLRPEYVDPETGGLDSSKVKGFMPDAWEINVERVRIKRGNNGEKDTYEFKTILRKASIMQFLDWAKEDTAAHFSFQKNFVTDVETMYEMQLCPHSYDPKECARCNGCFDVDLCEHRFEKTVCRECALDPHCLFEPLGSHDTDDPLLLSRVRATISEPTRAESLAEEVMGWYTQRKLDGVVSHCADACDSLVEAFQRHRSEILYGLIGSVACAALIYGGVHVYRSSQRVEQLLRGQGSTESMPKKLDSDVPNPWKKVVPVAIPKSQASRTSNITEMMDYVSKRIAHVYLYDYETKVRRKCDIVPMSNNIWLLPSHMLQNKEYTLEVQTTPRDQLGKNFSQVVDPGSWYRIPNTDFLIVRLLNGGDVADLSKFLPLDEFNLTGPLFARSLFKDAEGYVDRQTFKILECSEVESKAARFRAVTYNYPLPTFEGQCMMPVIADQKAPCIIGFHLAGKTGRSFGAAGTLTQKQYQDAVVQLNRINSLSCHSSGEMTVKKYGIDFTPSTSIDKHHCCKWLQDDEADGQQPVCEIFGEHPKGKSRFVSQVRKSPISDAVVDEMDLPRLHGKPNSQQINRHWHRDLNLMSHPKGNFRPKILRKAFADLQMKIDGFLDENPDMLDLVHPYPKDVVLAGMDGVTSVDRVDLTSSMGFPINKKKKEFLFPSDRVVDGITEPLDFEDPQYWAEVERMEQVLATGERVYAVHRGNLKDEPTKYTKDKIRVFAGCEFALTCLVRKYYLSIVRLIQTNWVDFECAVGINCHSEQWSELKEHVTKFGGRRMIAGDYKAFDKTATPSAMFSAFELLIHIAERAGYTETQLTIMRGLATEICLPLYEYSGVLLQIFGSNPSGHPMTVIVNNLENSLYLRYAYYAMHDGENVPLFHERVALMCYGDDNTMDVADDEDKFNHTSVAQELAKVGITYTMADKEAESIPYIGIDDVSFLKRGFVFSRELGKWVAPLEIASISKSLHNYMHRKGVDTPPEQIAAQAINTANMEFFYHGREVFEERRDQLHRVAQRSGISAYVGELPTYADLCERFRSLRHRRSALAEPSVIKI